MSVVQKLLERSLLEQSAISILRYPHIPGDTIYTRRVQERFKLALAQYPHHVKEVTTGGVLKLYIKCLGVELTDHSFHYFITKWIKDSLKSTNYTVDLDIGEATYCGVRPVSNLQDANGYYEFSFSSKHV